MRLALTALLAIATLNCNGAPTTATEVTATERFVVDVREPHTFAAEHSPGSVNLQLGWDQLEERIAAYGPAPGTPLALRAANEDQEREALEKLAELGFDDVVLLRDLERPRTLPTLRARELARLLEGPGAPVVIDVRSTGEHGRGHIEGALLFEQDEAPSRIEELDPSRSYAIICEGGYRSSAFASLLVREGFAEVSNVIDGMAGWRAADLPMVR